MRHVWGVSHHNGFNGQWLITLINYALDWKKNKLSLLFLLAFEK